MAGGTSELPRVASPHATGGTLKEGDFVTGRLFVHHNYARGSASIPIDLLARSAPNGVIGFYCPFFGLVWFSQPSSPCIAHHSPDLLAGLLPRPAVTDLYQ